MMNSTLKSLLVVAILCLVGDSSANAAIVYRLELSGGTGPLLNIRPSTAGDSLQVDVILELTGTTTLSLYSVSLGFDPTELTYVSGIETTPGPLTDVLLPLSLDNSMPSQPEIDGIDASTPIGTSTGASAGTYTIASLVFDVLIPSGDATDVDLVLFEDPLLDGSFDDGSILLDPSLGDASVTVSAVPEPSSVALLTCGSGVLCYLRRMKTGRTVRP